LNAWIGRHLLGLINAVLDLSKIEAGQLTLSINDYSLKEVVQSVFIAVESLATAVALHPQHATHFLRWLAVDIVEDQLRITEDGFEKCFWMKGPNPCSGGQGRRDRDRENSF
jgi:signal transduction histidine kinase